MIPPRPAVIAHDKVLRVQPTPALSRMPARVLVVRSASPSCLSGQLSRCLLSARERSRLETFRQRATVPTLLWVLIRQSLVEASPTCTPPPICTLAPFPIPRWSQDRGRR